MTLTRRTVLRNGGAALASLGAASQVASAAENPPSQRNTLTPRRGNLRFGARHLARRLGLARRGRSTHCTRTSGVHAHVHRVWRAPSSH